jgi:hypothetical protein
VISDSRAKPLHPPRPLWQILEEYQAHLKLRPSNQDTQALWQWLATKDRLKLWLEYFDVPH